jgi:hypothetical protein
MKSIEKLIPEESRRDGIGDDVIVGIEKEIQFIFPDDYKDLLRLSNGVSCVIGNGYIQIWAVEELIDYRDAYNFSDYVPLFLPIGSDGGAYAICLDYRESSDEPKIVLTPFGDICYESSEECARNFLEYINSL